MKYKNIIFDLDGTLLDTLNDIKTAINEALLKVGYTKQFSYDEAKLLIGSGARALVERALYYAGGKDEDLDKLGTTFLPLYKAYQGKTTFPYDGVIKTLSILKDKGYKLYILTNKPAVLLDELNNRFFKDYIIDLQGAVIHDICKPDPNFTKRLLEKNNLEVDESLYVGDSNIDILTAKNIGMDMCLCLFGYGDNTAKEDSYPKYKINKFEELLDAVEK